MKNYSDIIKWIAANESKIIKLIILIVFLISTIYLFNIYYSYNHPPMGVSDPDLIMEITLPLSIVSGLTAIALALEKK